MAWAWLGMFRPLALMAISIVPSPAALASTVQEEYRRVKVTSTLKERQQHEEEVSSLSFARPHKTSLMKVKPGKLRMAKTRLNAFRLSESDHNIVSYQDKCEEI